MRLKLIEGERPDREPTVEDMPHFDENFVYIPLWFVYYLAERSRVSKKSAFWHTVSHEILHIKKGHRPYSNTNIRCGRDFQMWANYHRKTELDAMPEPIDEEVRILNEAMRQSIENDIQFYRENYRRRFLRD